MRRFLVMLAFAGAVLLVLGGEAASADKKKAGGADANDGKVENWGKPKDYAPKKVTAFWVWYDDGVWHLRATGGGKGAHHFTGRVDVVGGKLVGLKGQVGEYGGKNVDRFAFNPTQTAFAFDFKTDEGEDGLNFAVDAAATGLQFTLALDGEAAPKHIRVGKAGDHPAEAVFTTPARPPEPPEPPKKDAKKKGKKG